MKLTIRFFALALVLCSVVTLLASSSEAKNTKAISALPDSAAAIISGYVRDSASGETIIGATLRVRGTKKVR